MPIITKERFKDITTKFPNLDPILIIGDIGIDKYTYGEVNRISPEAPVPVIEVKREWLKLGLAANISHNLKTLGIDSTLCGIIGEDKNADLFENLLEENYLKTWGVVRSADRPTTLKERVTTATQQICRVDYESNEDIDDVLSRKFFTRTLDLSEGHSGVIIQDYGKGSLTESLLRDYIDYFKTKNMLVAVDPSRTTKPKLYKGVDILKPNLLEATILLDELGYREKDIEKMAMILSEELEISKLIITLGGKGMALLENSNDMRSFQIIPTVANKVFDVSGAGDTAISLLMASYLSGATLEEASWIGNCGAGVVVGKKGTATVALDELSQFHNHLTTSLQ